MITFFWFLWYLLIMNNTFKIILFAATFLIMIGLGIFGLSNLKVDDFHKAAIVFVVDSSATNL